MKILYNCAVTYQTRWIAVRYNLIYIYQALLKQFQRKCTNMRTVTKARFGDFLPLESHHPPYIANEGSTDEEVMEVGLLDFDIKTEKVCYGTVMAEVDQSPDGQNYHHHHHHLLGAAKEGWFGGTGSTARETQKSHNVRNSTHVRVNSLTYCRNRARQKAPQVCNNVIGNSSKTP
ncbi:hypothetical protein C0J52_06308 [Blattella germanica]|nr:hypothetical protein C0J52_06308 [Blattella germanica]